MRVCHFSKPAGRQGTGKVNAKAHQLKSASENTENKVPLLQLGKGQAAPIIIDVTVNDVPVTMKVDTGAAVSVMSCQQLRKLFLQVQLHPIAGGVVHLHSRESGHCVLPVRVAYKGQDQDSSFMTVNCIPHSGQQEVR